MEKEFEKILVKVEKNKSATLRKLKVFLRILSRRLSLAEAEELARELLTDDEIVALGKKLTHM